MSDDLIERFSIDGQDAINTLKEAKKAADGVTDSLGESEKAAKGFTGSLADAEKESKRLEKTIAQQEKLTNEWRQELIRIEAAQKNIGKNKKEWFQLEAAAKKLNRAIKENTQDIKGLKIDKKIVDQNVKDLKAQEKAIKSNSTAATSFGQRIEKALSAVGINISGYIRRFQEGAEAIRGNAAATQGLAAANANATKSIGMTTAATKAFRAALISTGIGAIVVAIGSLAAAFFSTQRGADALNKVLKPLQSVLARIWGLVQDLSHDIVDAFDNPKQAVKDLGQAILDNIVNRFTAIPLVFEGVVDTVVGGLGYLGAKIKEFIADTPLGDAFDIDKEQVRKEGEAALDQFNKGLKDTGSAAIQVSLGIDKEQQKAIKDTLADAFNEGIEQGERLFQIQKQLDEVALRRAKTESALRLEFQEQYRIAQDVNKSAEERRKAGEAAIKANEKISALEREQLELEIERARIKNSQNDTDRQAEIEYQTLVSKRQEIDAQLIASNRRVQSAINTANKMQADAEEKMRQDRLKAEQEIADEIAKKRQEITEKDLSEFDKQRAEMARYYNDLEERAKENADQLIEIRKLRALEEQEIDAMELQRKVEREQQLIDAITEMRSTDVEKQIQAEQERFEKLFELASEDAEKRAELEQLLADRITEINAKADEAILADKRASAQAQIAALQSIANSAVGFMRTMAEDSRELALFEIAVNTAAGIASAVAAGAGVAFPANLAAIAAGIAAVLGGIAQAKSVMTQTPSFLGGGDTPGTRRSGGVDGKGGRYVIVHPNETIIDHHNPEKGLKALSKHPELDGWINRYYGASRLSQGVTNNYTTTTTSSMDDRRMVSKLSKSIDLQAATVAELRRMGKSKTFKRAG